MAKIKKEQKISVSNPKIGNRYHFKFAGSPMYGPIIALDKNLTKHYGYPWYWMTADNDKIICKYPISIYNIFNKI